MVHMCVPMPCLSECFYSVCFVLYLLFSCLHFRANNVLIKMKCILDVSTDEEVRAL